MITANKRHRKHAQQRPADIKWSGPAEDLERCPVCRGDLWEDTVDIGGEAAKVIGCHVCDWEVDARANLVPIDCPEGHKYSMSKVGRSVGGRFKVVCYYPHQDCPGQTFFYTGKKPALFGGANRPADYSVLKRVMAVVSNAGTDGMTKQEVAVEARISLKSAERCLRDQVKRGTMYKQVIPVFPRNRSALYLLGPPGERWVRDAIAANFYGGQNNGETNEYPDTA